MLSKLIEKIENFTNIENNKRDEVILLIFIHK